MFNYIKRIFTNRAGQKKAMLSIPVEQQSSENFKAGDINPLVPYEFLDFLEELVLTNPDFSQTVKRTVQLGNTGHYVEFDGLKNSLVQKATESIEELASSIFQPSAGMDGLVNVLFRQILVKGAISCEFVPSLKFDRVDRVVIVPVKSIRFHFDGKDFLPYQSVDGRMIPLNREQYIYVPLLQQENSPYGIPPFVSAMNLAFLQKDSLSDVKNIIRKYGLLGFVFAKRKLPFNENNIPDEEFSAFLQRDLQRFADNFRKNFTSGAAVSYDDVDITHHSIANDAKGATDIFQLIEQQIASGLDIDPSLLGRTYSTTETYAGVVYHAFLANLSNIRMLIKRVLEKIYLQHLLFQGFNLNRVTVTFNPDRALNPKQEIEAKKIEVETVLLKLDKGIIDLDTAARELGYEKATGLAGKK